MPTAILWFRQDLRLEDNPALVHATQHYDHILPLYILDDDSPGEWKMGSASCWWLHHSLKSLADSGMKLVLKKGDALSVLPALAKEINADAILWNRCIEPYARALDNALEKKLIHITLKSFNGGLLLDPAQLQNKEGAAYKVYTPFWNACLKAEIPEPLSIPNFKAKLISFLGESLESWHLLPTKPNWAKGFHWHPGENHGLLALKSFLEERVSHYEQARNMPAIKGTSSLSPYLHFGEISPRMIWHATQLHNAAHAGLKADVFLKEIVWREFNHHLLYHFPQIADQPFRTAYEAFPWQYNKAYFTAWCEGRTGYPIVDAGMRELWQTGWMHNRVRMIVASFLTKHLLIPWQDGAKWFWETLVDADLANNSGNWQWVAGSGADAAPYFRIFNPILQGKKFDPRAVYIRRFVPELKSLPDSMIHTPWLAEKTSNYPAPLVDHESARERALVAYQSIKGKK